MNKKRSVRNIGKEYSSYRGKVHNVYVNTKPPVPVGKCVPMNSFSPGHPVLGVMFTDEQFRVERTANTKIGSGTYSARKESGLNKKRSD